MTFERVHRSKSQTPQTSWSTSQFAPRPFPVQEPKRPPTQEELENQAFQQNKFEATGLQLKEKYGTITPVEQERLGMLQAKMDSFWAQRMERAKAQPNLLEILIRNAQTAQATKPAAPVQPKLTVGQPNDQYEQEADRVAEQVMSMAPPVNPNIQPQSKEEQEEVKTKPLSETITPIVQRQEALEEDEPIQAKCESCEAEEQVQRSPNGVPQVQADLENRLNASKGGGSPLPDEVRSFMEPRFKSDFKDVRIHTGSDATQMNRDLNAQAFTHKQDIYFGAGKMPGNNPLTAHELTHVIQQTTADKQIQRLCGVDESCPEEMTNTASESSSAGMTSADAPMSIAAPVETRQTTHTTVDDIRSAGEHITRTALHEAALREMYLRGDAAIRAEAEAMVAAGKSQEEVARWAVQARNELRRAIREQGEPIVDAIAQARRGARDMPTYESLRGRGKTDAQIIESAGRGNAGVNRWVGRIRIAGRILIAIDIGIAAYNVATAPEVDRPRVLAREVGRVGGALAGGWAGAKGGAAAGGFIGSFFGPGPGTAIGAGIGGVLGGIGGAVLGGWAAGEAAEWVIEQFYPPTETRFEGSYN